MQLFAHPENLVWFSMISVNIFEVNIVDLLTIFCVL